MRHRNKGTYLTDETNWCDRTCYCPDETDWCNLSHGNHKLNFSDKFNLYLQYDNLCRLTTGISDINKVMCNDNWSTVKSGTVSPDVMVNN